LTIVTFLSLKDTPFGALTSRGWFEVKTSALNSTEIRTVVYIDGDVTTKLIGGAQVDAASLHSHFAEIDQQASMVKKKLRHIVNAISTLWLAVAAVVIVVGHNLPNLLVALALLVPIVVAQVQRRLGLLLTVTPQASAVVGAAALAALAVGFGLHDVIRSAVVALALNISLIIGVWYARTKLKQLFTDAT
jgi:hypothetical protein